jgi:putative ABC transport system permease protein
VLGARGSQLQLVLNTVFHLETSPGNIPWSMYVAMSQDDGVELAVPYALGDNYQGFRVVGTTGALFERFPGPQGLRLEPGGRLFEDGAREAIVGSVVAARTGLAVGQTFHPGHGLAAADDRDHDDEFTVSGVLAATNSPMDRVVWIPIEGVYRMSGHVLRGTGRNFRAEAGQPIPDEHREVSAVLLKLKDPQAGIALDQAINRQGTRATFAWPIGRSMADLFEKIGWVNRILELIAYLVVVVAAGTILATLYNTMNERRREFAILRSLGARRGTVFSAIVLEATAIAGLGALAGYLVYAGILGLAFVIVRAQTGVVLDVFKLDPVLWWTPLGMLAVGVVAGLIPAMKAYRTDVATHLAPAS